MTANPVVRLAGLLAEWYFIGLDAVDFNVGLRSVRLFVFVGFVCVSEPS